MPPKREVSSWEFIDPDGSFRLKDPHKSNYLYFPLVNEAGMMSAITPILNGDIKFGQNEFLTLPVSVEDLHNVRSGRNFWVNIEGYGPWSVTGVSSRQISHQFIEKDKEEVILEAGFLWHKIIRANSEVGLEAKIVNFVPSNEDRVELMMVSLSNLSEQTIHIRPTAAIPIYGRSADNLHDHRHVTSLFHRIHCHTHGVWVCPTLSFDERGHQPNEMIYAILGAEEDGTPPIGFFPLVESFIGEGGSLDWPEAVVQSKDPTFLPGQSRNGYEALGGLHFQDLMLKPGESRSFIIVMGILDSEEKLGEFVSVYCNKAKFETWLNETRFYWKRKLDSFKIQTGDQRFDLWMRWVSLQPVLRRLYGNSFLPYHDYGRGGRGWRDLWQDILAFLLMEKGDVSEMLSRNFAGVRMDGSNATIIGNSPGEFRADRNDIPRVWMDHGAWPLLTVKFYIDLTGDLAFLLREESYFKDHLFYRSRTTDRAWTPEQGTVQKTIIGEPYLGTILEHLILQNLVPFLNVGEHNIIRLEDADWNDGLDMAPDRGESVAFTALYAGNLRLLGELVLALKTLDIKEISLASEFAFLLDTLEDRLDYGSVSAKQARLAEFFENCRHTISGGKIDVPLENLADDLIDKSNWLIQHLQRQEWIVNEDGYAWFNGYYDNNGMRVEGDHPNGVRMTLTGQVFQVMGGVAKDDQIQQIIQSADRYLYNSTVGGYRLNTDFGDLMLNFGRAFSFAFGHKENGSMFSHMAVMFANALYQRGFVHSGYRILRDIYTHAQNFPTSRMYPGIPEYISDQGRGMYSYLTGSASWYLMTLATEVFGVKGKMGDLVLFPKLVSEQFDLEGKASLQTQFANRRLFITYHNPKHLDFDRYKISEVLCNGERIDVGINCATALLPRQWILKLPSDCLHQLEVHLA